MTIDQRARAAAASVRQQVSAIEVPEQRAVLGRAARRRRLAVAVAGVVVIAAAGLGLNAAISDEPEATPLAVGGASPGWSRVFKEDAGLPWSEVGSSLDAVASDGQTAVLVGGTYRPGDDFWEAAIWWSDDGLAWHPAEHPAVTGGVFAVGIHDGVAIASGTRGTSDEPYQSTYIWRSEDSGRTWVDLGVTADVLGSPAPEMGRPNISQVVFRNGWWVASGGSSTGYAGIWVSRTGEEWEQVLESRAGGAAYLLDLDGERLMAYSGNTSWITDDPTDWGPALDDVFPPDLYRASIADGASLAVAESFESHTDRVVLRSDDEGRTWRVDESFSEEFPGAFPTTAAQIGGLSLVTGADGRSRPTAWVSEDGAPWEPSPESVRGTPGGVLILVAEIDGRVVIFGTAPELDRYYVFTP